MPRIHWVARGTGIPKDRDEVNGREVLLWLLFHKNVCGHFVLS
jgi:hypothetical protein